MAMVSQAMCTGYIWKASNGIRQQSPTLALGWGRESFTQISAGLHLGKKVSAKPVSEIYPILKQFNLSNLRLQA